MNLQRTIEKGVLQMLEPAVTVHARKKDISIVERAARGAQVQYHEISGRDVSVTVEGTLADDR